MSRRRYISTEMSTDGKLARLGAAGDYLAIGLYTWGISHADDWRRITGDPLEFKLTVCPAFAASVEDIDAALTRVAEVGLWTRYGVDGKQVIAYPREAFYRFQSYIPQAKREDDSGSAFPAPPGDKRRSSPQNAADYRAPAQKAASPSPSLSLSPSLSPSSSSSRPFPRPADVDDGDKPYPPQFEEFWEPCNPKTDKRKVYRLWRGLVGRKKEPVDPADLARASAAHYGHRESIGLSGKYPATFLGPDQHWKEWITGVPPDFSRHPGRAPGGALQGPAAPSELCRGIERAFDPDPPGLEPDRRRDTGQPDRVAGNG